jgi:hypothetical protein
MSKRDTLHRISGLFVGMLDKDELEVFDEACRRHQAVRSYEGGAGLMGLAKVRLIDTALSSTERESPDANI